MSQNRKMGKTGRVLDLEEVINGLKSIDELLGLLDNKLDDVIKDDEIDYENSWNEILTYVNALLRKTNRWEVKKENIVSAKNSIKYAEDVISRRAGEMDDPFARIAQFYASMKVLREAFESLEEVISEEQKDEKINYKLLMQKQERRISESIQEILAMIYEKWRLTRGSKWADKLVDELEIAIQQKRKIEDRRLANSTPEEVENLYMRHLENNVQSAFGMDFQQLMRSIGEKKAQVPEGFGQQKVSIDIPKSCYDLLVKLGKCDIEILKTEEQVDEDGKRKQGETFCRIIGFISISEPIYQRIASKIGKSGVYEISYHNLQDEVRKEICDRVYRNGLGEYTEQELKGRMKLGTSVERTNALLTTQREENKEKALGSILVKIKTIFSKGERRGNSQIPYSRNLVTPKDMQRKMDFIAVETAIRHRTPGNNTTREILEKFNQTLKSQRKSGVPVKEAYENARRIVFEEMIETNESTAENSTEELSPSQWVLDESYRRLLEIQIPKLIERYIQEAIAYYENLEREKYKPKRIPKRILKQRLEEITALSELIELSNMSPEIFLRTIIQNRDTLKGVIDSRIDGLQELVESNRELQIKEWIASMQKKRGSDKIKEDEIDTVLEQSEDETWNNPIELLRMLNLDGKEFKKAVRSKLREQYNIEAKKPKTARKMKKPGLILSQEEIRQALEYASKKRLFPKDIKDLTWGRETYKKYKERVAIEAADIAGEIMANRWKEGIKFAEVPSKIKASNNKIRQNVVENLPKVQEFGRDDD